MKVFTLEDIRRALPDKAGVIAAVRQGFMDHAMGRISLPEPTQILFGEAARELIGDCHIKTAISDSQPYFCVKVATGFYQNPDKGLPVNNGLVLLMSSQTGEPLALFQDQGHLTSIRTAAAGALAASLAVSSGSFDMGVVGTGHQAEMQARWIAQSSDVRTINIWGRTYEKAMTLAERLQDVELPVNVCESMGELCQKSKVVVTTTPATSPIVQSADIKAGHHIIAMGADSPGKTEIDPEILRRADVILTDDHDQCLHHGEFGVAVRAGLCAADDDQAFGAALAEPDSLNLHSDSIVVVDLTGLGVQDLALAGFVYVALIGSPPARG